MLSGWRCRGCWLRVRRVRSGTKKWMFRFKFWVFPQVRCCCYHWLRSSPRCSSLVVVNAGLRLLLINMQRTKRASLGAGCLVVAAAWVVHGGVWTWKHPVIANHRMSTQTPSDWCQEGLFAMTGWSMWLAILRQQIADGMGWESVRRGCHWTFPPESSVDVHSHCNPKFKLKI